MKRTNIYLTDRQVKELKEIADKLGLSTAELIRRVLDLYLENKKGKG